MLIRAGRNSLVAVARAFTTSLLPMLASTAYFLVSAPRDSSRRSSYSVLPSSRVYASLRMCMMLCYSVSGRCSLESTDCSYARPWEVASSPE